MNKNIKNELVDNEKTEIKRIVVLPTTILILIIIQYTLIILL